MPNIEIHGVKKDDTKHFRLTEKIFKRVEGLVFAGELVLTKVMDDCRDRNNKSQPFLRIIISEKSKIEPLVQQLKPLGIDMEILIIDGFIPGEKN